MQLALEQTQGSIPTADVTQRWNSDHADRFRTMHRIADGDEVERTWRVLRAPDRVTVVQVSGMRMLAYRFLRAHDTGALAGRWPRNAGEAERDGARLGGESMRRIGGETRRWEWNKRGRGPSVGYRCQPLSVDASPDTSRFSPGRQKRDRQMSDQSVSRVDFRAPDPARRSLPEGRGWVGRLPADCRCGRGGRHGTL